MKKSSIVLSFIALFTVYVLSPFGLSGILYLITSLYPITIKGASGSLWHDNIHINSIIYSNQNQSIHVQNISAHDFSVLPFGFQTIEIEHIDTNYIPMPTTSKSTLQQRISIQSISFRPAPVFQPIQIENLVFLSSEKRKGIKLNIQEQTAAIQITPFDQPNHNQIEIQLNNKKILISELINQHQITYQSTANSDLKGLTASYLPDQSFFQLSINHQAEGIIQLDLGVNTQSLDIALDIQKFELPILGTPLIIDGNIDTIESRYSINAHHGDSYLKTHSMDEEQLILSANISDMFFLSPYVKGGCELNINYTPQRVRAYAYSPNMLLPLARFSDLQLSYDSTSRNTFYLSAAQLRNPLLLINQPSISLQRIDTGIYELLALGLYNDAPQTLLTKVITSNEQTSISFDKFNISTGDRAQWELQQPKPFVLTEKIFELPEITLTASNQQSITLSGQYDLNSHQWSLAHATESLLLAFNSQGIVDDDTEVVLNSATLNGQGITHGAFNEILSTQGNYILSGINATILNLVPDFSFPLDYHMQDSFIKWSDSSLSGTLYSDQGNIQLSSQNDAIHIHSPNISFNDAENHAQASVDLIKDPNQISGDIHVFDLGLTFDPNASFITLPKDINILGDIPAPKPDAASIDVDINLHFSDTPTMILGIAGQGSGKLNLFIPKNSLDESVTGSLIFSNPSLTILNRRIPLNNVSLEYNNQMWNEGSINLTLKQKTTITANNEATKAEINLAVSGKLSSPSFDISTNPIHLSKDQSLTQILLASPLLPKGNENHQLLELISGLKRNEGLIVILQTLNNLSFLSLDISLRRGMSLEQSIPSSLNDVELLVSKKIYDRLSLAFQKPLNDDLYTFSLDFRLSPKLSVVGEYNSNEFFSLNLLSNN